jgi:hypothetical protein
MALGPLKTLADATTTRSINSTMSPLAHGTRGFDTLFGSLRYFFGALLFNVGGKISIQAKL